MRLYTLVIDHRHGTNIYNFLSESEMNEALYTYVKENWQDDDNIEELDRAEAIERYFPWAEDWYTWDYVEFPVISDRIGALRDALGGLVAHIEDVGSDFSICKEIMDSSYGRAAVAVLEQEKM